MIKKGELVEFTDQYQRHYTIGDPDLAQYGVALENEGTDCLTGTVLVQTSQGPRVVPGANIHASGWAGWVPEELEDIYEEIQNELYPFDPNGDDLWDYF